MADEPNFEDAALLAIGEDFSNEKVDATTTQGAEATQQQTSQQTQAQDAGNTQQVPAKQDSNSGKPDSGKQQGKEEKGQTARGPQDLTLQDGTVIKGGTERRLYEKAQLANQRLTETQRDLQEAQRELGNARNVLQAERQTLQGLHGVDAPTLSNSVRLYQDLLRDPVGTATKILAELKAKGHNVEGIGSQVDTQAILALSRQNQPQTRQGPTQEQIDQQSQQEVNQFFGRYPDARIHEDAIARFIAAHPQATLSDAYYRLKEMALDGGYDWQQPLGTQVQARRTQGQNGTTPQQQQQQRPMVSGRGGTPNVVEERVAVTPASGGTWDDIIRSSMVDARS